MYLPEEEIVNHMMLYSMPESTKQVIRKMHKADLVVLHGEIGSLIRTKFKLWDENNPYAVFDPSDLNHPNHPERVSMRIIETIWGRLQ